MGDRGARVTATTGSASRVALCIGVSKYASSPLKNPAHDAADVAEALRAIGFQATLLLEPSLKQMLDGLEAFVAALQPGGTAVFFFAGARFASSATGTYARVRFPLARSWLTHAANAAASPGLGLALRSPLPRLCGYASTARA